jgi:hypothetical protein
VASIAGENFLAFAFVRRGEATILQIYETDSHMIVGLNSVETSQRGPPAGINLLVSIFMRLDNTFLPELSD